MKTTLIALLLLGFGQASFASEIGTRERVKVDFNQMINETTKESAKDSESFSEMIENDKEAEMAGFYEKELSWSEDVVTDNN